MGTQKEERNSAQEWAGQVEEAEPWKYGSTLAEAVFNREQHIQHHGV